MVDSNFDKIIDKNALRRERIASRDERRAIRSLRSDQLSARKLEANRLRDERAKERIDARNRQSDGGND